MLYLNWKLIKVKIQSWSLQSMFSIETSISFAVKADPRRAQSLFHLFRMVSKTQSQDRKGLNEPASPGPGGISVNCFIGTL